MLHFDSTKMNICAFFLSTFTLAITWTAFVVANITYDDCGSTGVIQSLEVSPCSPTPSGGCFLDKGRNTSIAITFIPPEDVSAVTAKVAGKLWKTLLVPFTGIPADACTQIDEGCPLVAGNTYTYRSQVHVQDSYPAITVEISYQLLNEHDKSKLVCFLLDSQIRTLPVHRRR